MASIELLRHRLEDVCYEKEPSIQESLVDTVHSQLGKRVIRHGEDDKGMDPDEGFDCSGLVSLALDQIDYPRNGLRHCREFFDFLGNPNLILPGFQEKGDLVFFSWNGNLPQHIGIMISKRAYVHALLKTGEVSVSALKFRQIVPGPKTINPQKYPENPIGFKRLFPLSETEK